MMGSVMPFCTQAKVEGAVPFVNEIYIDLCHQVGTPPR